MSLSDAEVAVAAALAGAEVVARNYGASHARFAKSATNFATATDVDAEAAMVTVLASHRPRDRLTREEGGDSGPAASPRRWLIDPLCGTLNFAATTPLFAVNVALIDDTDTAAAASIDPIADELFWTDGSQAYLRGGGAERTLVPSAVSGLVETNCDGPLDRPFVCGQLVHDPSAARRLRPSGHLLLVGRCLGRGKSTGGVHLRWHVSREPALRRQDRDRDRQAA